MTLGEKIREARRKCGFSQEQLAEKMSVSRSAVAKWETIDFLLNREEAHNQMFRDAFNQVQNSGSNQDFGTTKAARMYFSMSDPGPNAFAGNPVNPPKFSN